MPPEQLQVYTPDLKKSKNILTNNTEFCYYNTRVPETAGCSRVINAIAVNPA